MKLVSYSTADSTQPRLGAVLDKDVLDLHTASDGKIPPSMLEFIESGEKMLDLARKSLRSPAKQALKPLAGLTLKAPLPNPPSLKDFFAFEDHAKAGSVRRNEPFPEQWYEIPAYYKGNHREIYGPEDEIPWPSYTRRLDFECEIACVIGKKGRNLTTHQAPNYIFGYMIFNDYSARDIQKKEMLLRMGPAKSKDFANAFGPYLVTSDEVDPQKDFSMKIKVNGEPWSEGHFKHQYWGFPILISHLSQDESIFPGDILGSGTFHNGCGLDLNRWLKAGDVLELKVPSLGTLRNKIGHPARQQELNYRKKTVGSKG